MRPLSAAGLLDPITTIVAIGLVILAAVFCCLRSGRRHARELRGVIQALGRRLEAHDAAITTLGRAVAALAPADARPTKPNAPSSMPFRPAPAEIVAARAAYTAPPPSAAQRIERAVLPEPPVDTTGDRAGWVPEPPSHPSVEPSPWPPASERDSSQDLTRVMSYDDASRAALAARCAIRPPPFERAVASRTREPTPSAPPIAGDPIEARYQTLRCVARAAGEACDHCHGADCWADEETILCTCPCLGCTKARELSSLAEREVLGVPSDRGTGGAA